MPWRAVLSRSWLKSVTLVSFHSEFTTRWQGMVRVRGDASNPSNVMNVLPIVGSETEFSSVWDDRIPVKKNLV